MAAVVGAAIVREGRVLAARRTSPPDLAGRWEFPGGKVEHGESAEDALVREIAEELGCEITIVSWLPEEVTIGERHTLTVAVARLDSGDPVPHEHDEVRWVGPDELEHLPWLAADRAFLAPLCTLLGGG